MRWTWGILGCSKLSNTCMYKEGHLLWRGNTLNKSNSQYTLIWLIQQVNLHHFWWRWYALSPLRKPLHFFQFIISSFIWLPVSNLRRMYQDQLVWPMPSADYKTTWCYSRQSSQAVMYSFWRVWSSNSLIGAGFANSSMKYLEYESTIC